MMKTKVLIVGLGGVGGYFGGLLARQYENDSTIEIYFLARGKHLEAIKSNGLTVKAETETFVVRPTLATDNASEIGKVDYVLLTPKSYDLVSTIEQIKPCINSKTILLPLLNGADISSRIKKILPDNEVWSGCAYIVGRLIEPGVIESSGGVHDLFFGYKNQKSEQLEKMEKILIDAKIEAKLSENIDMIMWRKFIFISATASLTSYFNVSFRDLLTDDTRKETTLTLFNEVYNLAIAEGITFDKDILKTILYHIERLPLETTSSMHSDFIAGKNTEIETLTKTVIDLGVKHNLPTPTYNKVYKALLERKMYKN